MDCVDLLLSSFGVCNCSGWHQHRSSGSSRAAASEVSKCKFHCSSDTMHTKFCQNPFWPFTGLQWMRVPPGQKVHLLHDRAWLRPLKLNQTLTTSKKQRLAWLENSSTFNITTAMFMSFCCLNFNLQTAQQCTVDRKLWWCRITFIFLY